MINLFATEYMMHPVGLEMSQNACGHNCFYCFATLKNPKRKFNPKAFASQMNNFKTSNTFLAKKIRDGYPFVFSNNTDPFAKNNVKLTEEMLPVIIANNIPVFFQTKTGYTMIDVLNKVEMPPSVFYVSLTSIRDDISRRIERLAPVYSERIEFIKELQKMGHYISVGINPLAEEWLPEDDLLKLIETCNNLGIKSFAVGELYFRKRELEKVKKYDKAGVDEKKYIKNNNSSLYYQRMIVKYHDKGLITPNLPFYCEGIKTFLSPKYKKILTVFDFINHIIDKHKDEFEEITFEDYFNFFDKCGYIEDGYKLDSFIFAMRTNMWIGRKENQNVYSKEHFYRILWNEEGISQNLSTSLLFTKLRKDDNGNDVYLYAGGRHVEGEFYVNLNV